MTSWWETQRFANMTDDFLYNYRDRENNKELAYFPNEYPSFGKLMYYQKKVEEKVKNEIKFDDVIEFFDYVDSKYDLEWMKNQLAKIFVEIASECNISYIDYLCDIVEFEDDE